MSNKIKTILSRWRSAPNIAENVVEWRVLAQKSSQYLDFPEALSPRLFSQLKSQGINALFEHQALAFQKVLKEYNIAIVSGTASGKTLFYNLPVVNSLLNMPEGKALYIFPTKAYFSSRGKNERNPI